jgi:hypothetical protein
MPIALAFIGPQQSQNNYATQLKAHGTSDIWDKWVLPAATIVGGLTLAGQVAVASVDMPSANLPTTTAAVEISNGKICRCFQNTACREGLGRDS